MKPKMILRELYITPSKVGEKLKWDWLTYNPGVFFEFDMVAKRNAPLFCESLVKTFPSAESYCDVGCGTGRYSKVLLDLGKNVVAYEYTKLARRWASRRGVGVSPFDVSKSNSPELKVKCDIAFSLEVAEHVPAEFALNFVKFITNCSDQVIFTAAAPGQSGVAHVNCQPKQYWVDNFSQLGYDQDITSNDKLYRSLRTFPKISPFLFSNLLIFKRRLD